MKTPWLTVMPLLAAGLALAGTADAEVSAECPALFQHTLQRLHSSEQVDLCEVLAGKPVLVVNTASYCGFTRQFGGLEALYQAYRGRGLEILGVPSNDFRQEARDEASTAEVCYVNYGVTFTMTAPQNVRGADAHPLFQVLAAATTAPAWNFNKYLVAADGEVVAHFSSRVAPDDPRLVEALEALLPGE